MIKKCPNLWNTLVLLAGNEVVALGEEQEKERSENTAGANENEQGDGEREDQEQNNPEVDSLDGFGSSIKPHPNFGTILCISSLVYRRNRLNNKFQAITSVYAHAKHTDKALHGLLHLGGIVLSYPWTTRLIKTLNKAKHQKAIEIAESRAFMLCHDNIRLKFPIQSQRGNNQSVSDNGTAITMFALPESARIFEQPDNFGPFNRTLRSLRIQGLSPRLTWKDLMDPKRLQRVRTDYIFDILDFLRMVPGLKGSKVLAAPILQRLVGPQQLLHGKQHRTEMYMLPTVNVDESTYGGNSQIIHFVLQYLKLTESDLKQNRLALDRKVPWMGDQATFSLCEGLQFFLNESENPIERLECFIYLFGGFHSEMAIGAGTFEKSRGTSSGLATFARDVILLSRTGLNANMNKSRPKFHDCDEFLLHELEARMRGAFLVESGCSTEDDLVTW
ncbi:hypothetical protein FRC07_014170, partial [Ceratobasidium sp. 392]